MSLRVASLERTMVDVLSRPRYSGGWEEVWRSLESVEFFDLDTVVEYTLLLKNATAAATVGFFLRQHQDTLMVEERYLDELRSNCPRQPHYLDRSKSGGRLVSEWNLVVPPEVIERSWARSGMRISQDRLIAESEATGFQPEFLEKTFHLLVLLSTVNSHPFLRGKLALKGGTALNLFVFDVPRLSVDIDLNYVGAESREDMMAERPGIEEALQAVFRREDYSVRLTPGDSHAGGKWSLRYATASGQSGRIDVDVNYMYRVPLWPVTSKASRPLGTWERCRVSGSRHL